MVKKPPAWGSPKRSIRASAAAHRLAVPARIERRLVQREERVEQEGLILEVAVEVTAPVLPRPQQPAIGVAQLVSTKDAQSTAASR